MSLGYQRKKENLESEVESNRINFYKFKEGKTLIRIMPAFNPRGVWFKKVQEHFLFLPGIESGYFVSPRTNNERDPLYDYGGKLYKAGGQENIEAAKKLRPRTRYYVNAIILSSPHAEDVTNKVITIPLAERTFKELYEYDIDEASGWGDITSVENGVNIEVKREGKTVTDTKYSVKVHPQRVNILKLLEAKGVDPSSLELPDLDELFVPASAETLTKVLDTIISSGALFNNAGQEVPTGSNIGRSVGTSISEPVAMDGLNTMLKTLSNNNASAEDILKDLGISLEPVKDEEAQVG